MKEYIEREEALDAISEWLMKALHPENMSSYNEGERAAYRTALSEIAEIPAADVRPVARGKWVQKKSWTRGVCSACSWKIAFVTGNSYNFCPNCGTDMRGEQDV